MRYIRMVAAYICLVVGLVIIFLGSARIHHKDRQLGLRYVPRGLEYNKEDLSRVADALTAFHKSTGRYPTNDEFLTEGKRLKVGYSWDAGYPILWAGKEVYSLTWGGPIAYENRTGLDPSKFADSGVSRDPKRVYSLKVDEGIYLWSPTVEHRLREYGEWSPRLARERRLVEIAGLVFIVLFLTSLGLGVRATPAGLRLRYLGRSMLIGGIVTFVLSAILFPAVASTCYIVVIRTRMTTGGLRTHAGLIAKYHARGIIRDETYQKIMKVINRHPDWHDGKVE